MIIVSTDTFKRKVKKLRLHGKFIESIMKDFEEMTHERASQYEYYKEGPHKAYKKYRKGDYRIHFAYCKECFGKYSQKLKCSFCNKNNLERVVLINIRNRKKGY